MQCLNGPIADLGLSRRLMIAIWLRTTGLRRTSVTSLRCIPEFLAKQRPSRKMSPRKTRVQDDLGGTRWTTYDQIIPQRAMKAIVSRIPNAILCFISDQPSCLTSSGS